MNPELLKLITLPSVLAVTITLVVLTTRYGMPTLGNWLTIVGWLAASLGMALLARESLRWPLAGYLQNLVAFLGLCAVPFGVGYVVSSWLQARGLHPVIQLGVSLTLAIIAILPAAFAGPYWGMFLRSTFGWEYIRYP
jgi:hypothetical protein